MVFTTHFFGGVKYSVGTKHEEAVGLILGIRQYPQVLWDRKNARSRGKTIPD